MDQPAIFLFLFLPFLIAKPASAQVRISGRVTDSRNEAITGANVYLEGAYDGASTDAAGNFDFQSTEQGEQTLVVSFLGYAGYQKTIRLGNTPVFLEIILKENALELENVVITAGAFEAGGESKREILKPLDILTTAGATGDIAGALNTLPGTQTVGESGRLFVRGGEGYETQTFIDGMQVMNFYSPAAPNTPGRSRFMPQMFSGVSFSTGGYSAEYGQALSSALILNSKFLATQDRIDLSLMSVGADVAVTRSWDHTSLSAKAQYTNLDPYTNLIGQEIDWIDAPTSAEASAAFRQKLSSSGILKVFGNFNRSSFTLDRPAIADPADLTRTRISNRYVYLNGMFQEVTGKHWSIRGGLSYTRSRNDTGLDEASLGELENGLHSKLVISREFAGQAALKLGGEYFYRRFSQHYDRPAEPFSHQDGFREQLGALFAESDIYITGSLLARLGLRSEYSALDRRFQLAPRLSLALKISEKSQLSAAFGLFQQAPQNHWWMVAPQLGPEKALHYILNYQISSDNRTFRAELYHKQYLDLVKFDPAYPDLPERYDNTGSGYARGLDLFWRDNRSLRNVDYWVSYSYLDTERDYRDFPLAATPAFAGRHNLSVVYKHFIPALKSQIGLTYKFASGRPYHDPNQGIFMGKRTPAYQDLSANISYLLRQHIIVHGSATNLPGFDQVFGYEFATAPDAQGHFPGRAVRPAARRFLFLGVFITFSRDAVMNQLPDL